VQNGEGVVPHHHDLVKATESNTTKHSTSKINRGKSCFEGMAKYVLGGHRPGWGGWVGGVGGHAGQGTVLIFRNYRSVWNIASDEGRLGFGGLWAKVGLVGTD